MTKIALSDDLKDLFVITNGSLSTMSLSGSGVFLEISSRELSITAVTGSPSEDTICTSENCQVAYDGNEDRFYIVGELDLVLNLALPENAYATENALESPISVISVSMGSRTLIIRHDGSELVISEEV